MSTYLLEQAAIRARLQDDQFVAKSVARFAARAGRSLPELADSLGIDVDELSHLMLQPYPETDADLFRLADDFAVDPYLLAEALER
ncbi:MAG: hypothetical protein HY329_18805 [Chloroflexi bacterium]|nr:hypothetical protein [Chloroflexota bacterium]